MSDVARWWAFVLRYEAREMWRALPGPWWVKVLLIVVTVVALPGPADELILIAVTAALRKRRARRELAAGND